MLETPVGLRDRFRDKVTEPIGRGAIGHVAQLIGIAEQLGDEEMAERLEGILKTRFEKWFTGSSGFYFAYDKNVGSVLGFPRRIF